jgi:hypothetical protein
MDALGRDEPLRLVENQIASAWLPCLAAALVHLRFPVTGQ